MSYILLKVTESKGDFEAWMGEVKRYEGNRIESEEIKEDFWLNLVLVNEKYDAYKKNQEEYDRYERYQSKSFLLNMQAQQDALKKDIIERCQDCYELMKLDSVAEREERLSLSGSASVFQLEVPEEVFVTSEEKAMLKILESPVASFEMKAEAQVLLDKWRKIHVGESRPSAEEESMRMDILTVRNILEGKEVGMEDSPVLNETVKQ